MTTLRCFVLFLMVVLAPGSLAAQDLALGPRRSAATEEVDALPQQPQLFSLGEAVALAMERSRDIHDARYALEVAEEQVTEAWGSVYPRVDFTGSYTRNVSPMVNFIPAKFFDPSAGDDELRAVQFGADNAWSTSITFEQPLFEAQAFLGVGAAGRYRTLQEEILRGRTQTLVTRVRLGFYDLLLAQEEYRLVENSIGRVRQSLEETEAMNRAGLASEYDMLRMQVELANLEPNLRRTANAVSQAQRQLALELDLEDLEGFGVTGTLAEMDLDDLSANSQGNREILAFVGRSSTEEVAPEELVERSKRERSDVRQLELMEQLRKTELRVEQVEYMPKVSMFGTYSINAQQNGSPDFFATGERRAYSRLVGVSVSVPLFTGMKRNARIDQKRATLRQAETQTLLMRDQAEIQVRTLLERIDEARARARGQRLAVQQAGRGFEIASAQFREGLSSHLELTDAEVALRQSEYNYAQAVYDYLVARAQLDEALGQVPVVDVEVVGG
ncbi:MAG: TolC family protein [Gemmatimonadetes bacterium]|nr:TolC family protein [Gemmatimonadota bacterium]